MNQIILDGVVQKNPNLLSDISSFNISAITGTYKLANNIMRLIQKEYQNKMYITVKFEKK